MKEKKLRIEDALNATRAAVEEGVVAGGGTILRQRRLRCGGSATAVEGDEKTGVRIITKALDRPRTQIAANAGIDGSVVLEKIRESRQTGLRLRRLQRDLLRHDRRRYHRSHQGDPLRSGERRFHRRYLC